MRTITDLIRTASGGDHPETGELTRFAQRVTNSDGQPASPSTVTRWRDGTVPASQWWQGLADELGVDRDEIERAATSGDDPTRTDLMAAIAALARKIDAGLERQSDLLDLFDKVAAQLEQLTDRLPAPDPGPARRRRKQAADG